MLFLPLYLHIRVTFSHIVNVVIAAALTFLAELDKLLSSIEGKPSQWYSVE